MANPSPKFSAKGATEWTKLVDDLLASASSGSSQSTSVEKLKERFGKIEVGINVAPSRVMNDQLRRMGKSLDSKFASLNGAGDSKENESVRKAIRDELKSMERGILRQSMQAQSTIGRQILQSQRLKEKDAAREFKKNTKENYKELQETLSKQLLDVTEHRGMNDSEGLQQLQRALAESLRALKSDDYEHYRDLSNQIDDAQSSFGVSAETSKRLGSIQDLVQDQSRRRSQKHDKIEKGLGYVGLGGIYRKGRSLARGASRVASFGRSAKNFASRSLSGGAATARAASLAASVSKNPSENEQSASQGQEEGSLLRRQVKALETLSNASRKKSSGSGEGIAGSLKSVFGKLGTGGLMGMGKLLGSIGLVGAAAWAGWSLGGMIYDKYKTQIDDAVEVVMGVVNKSIEFASKGVQWMTEFLSSPIQKIKDAGGKLKEIWNKSVFSKFFSSPDKIGAEGATAMIQASGAPAPSGAAASAQTSAAFNGISSKLNSGKDVAKNTSELLKPSSFMASEASNPYSAAAEKFEAGSNYSMARATVGGLSPVAPFSFGAPPSPPPRSVASVSSPAAASSPVQQSYPGMASRSIGFVEEAKAQWERESVPAAPTVKEKKPDTQSSQGPGPEAQGEVSRGSVASIPTFSYMDSGFFLMNAGVIG